MEDEESEDTDSPPGSDGGHPTTPAPPNIPQSGHALSTTPQPPTTPPSLLGKRRRSDGLAGTTSLEQAERSKAVVNDLNIGSEQDALGDTDPGSDPEGVGHSAPMPPMLDIPGPSHASRILGSLPPSIVPGRLHVPGLLAPFPTFQFPGQVSGTADGGQDVPDRAAGDAPLPGWGGNANAPVPDGDGNLPAPSGGVDVPMPDGNGARASTDVAGDTPSIQHSS